ncbi:MAG: hypothetical protein DDT40_00305 [candidate division WS2 bacterium]|nr:MAG: DUF86 domain-containing protein [Methanosarcinales archaeon Met12]MBT9150139.1 hypothetical protein [Candidatus Psychracetigena formicireducens]
MFDKEGVIDHLRELEEATGDWKRYQSISLKELRSDRDKRNMVLHALLVSIQTAIDIANHLITERGLRKPSTYRESFEILSEEGILPSELGDALSDLAGFRNVLVHIYWKLNLEEVYGVLKNDLKIIKEFSDIIKKLLR